MHRKSQKKKHKSCLHFTWRATSYSSCGYESQLCLSYLLAITGDRQQEASAAHGWDARKASGLPSASCVLCTHSDSFTQPLVSSLWSRNSGSFHTKMSSQDPKSFQRGTHFHVFLPPACTFSSYSNLFIPLVLTFLHSHSQTSCH